MTRNRPIPTLSSEDTAFARSLVVHEDTHLIAFNKPSGLAVQTRGNRGPCLENLLPAFAKSNGKIPRLVHRLDAGTSGLAVQTRGNRGPCLENLLPAFAKSNGKIPRLVHRLDAGTSGLLIAAKTKPAAAHLSGQFAKRLARKTYLALVGGDIPSGSAGTIDQPLLKCVGQRGTPPMIASDSEGAQSASTHWRILSRASRTSYIELRPKTGRMHQLRAHMKHLGCPILGDKLYGTGKLSAERLMLHAARLRLPLPDDTELDLTADIPDEMKAHAVRLGLEVPPT